MSLQLLIVHWHCRAHKAQLNTSSQAMYIIELMGMYGELMLLHEWSEQGELPLGEICFGYSQSYTENEGKSYGE